MTATSPIPAFTLFGETAAFPDVVHCERIAARAPVHGWTISAHRHAQMAQLFLIESGAADAVVDGQTLTLRDGDAFFVPAQAVHSFSFAPGTAGLVQSFPLAILSSIAPTQPELTVALTRPISGPADSRLVGLMYALAEALHATGTFRAQIAVGLAHAVLASAAEMRTGAARASQLARDARLDQFEALLARHLADGWGPADFARAMSISTGHLARICRAGTGTSTLECIDAARMQEAGRLLAFTRMSVAEAGFRLGFNDPSYFSRRFRAAHGRTPSAYRRQFASGDSG